MLIVNFQLLIQESFTLPPIMFQKTLDDNSLVMIEETQLIFSTQLTNLLF
jgi:hypothetical protein